MRRRPLSRPPTSTPPATPDRRGEERCPRGLSASWRLLGAADERAASASVCDLSRTGVALLVGDAVREGAILIVRLHDSSGRLAAPRVAHVKHATCQDDGRWLVGCAFATPLPEDDLAELFRSTGSDDPAAAGARSVPAEAAEAPLVAWLPGRTWERRQSLRRRLPRVRVVLWDPRSGTRGLGWVADVSQGGLGVMALRPFREEAVVRVRAANAEECVPWIEVVVRACRRQEQRWFLGCQFNGNPPPLGLRLLG
jgi:hypothetical protein